MELTLAVADPSRGTRADVLVSAPEGSCLADVTDALLAQVLPAGDTGGLVVDGRAVAPESLLGAPPLVHGALLEVGRPGPRRLHGPELHVVGGPSAGTVVRLTSADVVVGRDDAADLRLADAQASRRHCAVRWVDGAAEVRDLGSTNGTRVDGVPLDGAARLLPGSLLAVGGSRLQVVDAPAPGLPVDPHGDGTVAVTRPPRVRPDVPVVQVVVPSPPADAERSPFPLLAVVAPLLLGVVLWRVTGSTTFLVFTLLSPVLAVGQVVTERRSGRRRGRRARALWRAQRDVAERVLADAVRDDEQRRRQAGPDPAEVLSTALGPRARLWERREGDPDRLVLRLGLADLPAQVEAEGDLPEAADVARDVPLEVSLPEVGVLGVAGPRPVAQALVRGAVGGAAVLHSPRDLQVVVLAEAAAASAWDWARWLPHSGAGDSGCRSLLGLGLEQAAARVAELSALVAARCEAAAAPGLPAVLLVVDGARALRAVPGLAALLRTGPSVGVFAVCLDDDLRRLPEECGATAQVSEDDLLVTGRTELRGRPDLVSAGWASRVARALAPLRDGSAHRGGSAALPTSVRWTELVGLDLTGSPADATAVVERWAAPGRSTEALLGQGADGPVAVDLVRDGPHALVAGTTGAGKSELLQALLASLALANRPDELQAVLVDYKGGAAFGACARLPHVVGTVTDLDGALVERALQSLTAELSRREAVLAEVGAKDVEEHRRRVGRPGGPTEVLPRLLLVVDEFASLVEELPDFVGGLVGIAQRGRSLGVHLVLATQRPEGVVSADIRANANLRLCLAVTRDTESRDVIDSPLAATVSRRTPGRGYVRTGHGELTAFQTGRVGGRRPATTPSDHGATVALLPTADLGDPVPVAAGGAEREETSDLALLVDACVAAAEALDVETPRSPWLAPLPALVERATVPTPVDARAGTPGRVPPLVYGVLDVPAEQSRRPAVLDLDLGTHLLVVGAPRSGRTTALRAVAAAAATASPDDLHLHVLDLGGALRDLTALPHTGAVVGRDDPERTARLLDWLLAEAARRATLLSEQGLQSASAQRAAARPEERLPHLLLLLDRWEAFVAAYQDLDAGRLVDAVLRLLREGPAVGLHVVVSADRSGLVGRLAGAVEDTLLLRLADRGDYPSAGLPARLVPDELPAGRGWSVRPTGAPLVVQVVADATLPARPAPPTPLHPPHRVEPLPAVVLRSDLPVAGRPLRVVLGVGGDELDPVEVDLADAAPGWLVAGPPGSGRSSALLAVAHDLARRGTRVVALAPRPSPLRTLPGCLTDLDDSAALAAALAAGPCALLVDDAELAVDAPVGLELERAVRAARDSGSVVVAAGTTDDLVTGYRGFVVDLRRSRTGLLLSPQSAADGDLLGARLSRATGGPVQPGRGLLVERGRVTPLQVALATSAGGAEAPGAAGC